MNATPPTMALAKFASDTQDEAISREALHHAKRSAINMLGAALHATQNPASHLSRSIG